MPNELRKRGKKNKHRSRKTSIEEHGLIESVQIPENRTSKDIDFVDAPFGIVDPDLKAYFRNFDTQIREFENFEDKGGRNVEQEESLSLFFSAALKEMSGKELQLATDQDCSLILERMIYSMDDFTLRVFMDSLCGSILRLSTHRFSSHVCQTCFDRIPAVVDREARGKTAEAPEKAKSLRAMTDMILDIVNELLPVLSEMMTDQFGSHVLQSLLYCLDGVAQPAPESRGHDSIRSNKSRNWKAKHSPITPSFQSTDEKLLLSTPAIPQSFGDAKARVLHEIKTRIFGNELRLLAGNAMSSPLLQCLLKIEARLGESEGDGSLMDQVLAGLISAQHHDMIESIPSDFVNTLLRDTVGSHIIEAIVTCCSDKVFELIWKLYISPQIVKLALHPTGNFVIACSISRLEESAFIMFMDAMQGVWPRIIKSSRSRVLLSTIKHSYSLPTVQGRAMGALLESFDLENGSADLVSTVLGLNNMSGEETSFDPSLQGSLLLQSTLGLAHPFNEPILNSLRTMNIDQLVKIATNPISSRVIDAALESETLSRTYKRKLILLFMAKYLSLARDKIGSRVAERCWRHADLFCREKIANSLTDHQESLMQSYYGKFFSRTLQLSLFQRDLRKWREVQMHNPLRLLDDESRIQDNLQVQVRGKRKADIDGGVIHGSTKRSKAQI